MPRIITRTILVLSLVSLFNDISSELLIPIMPIYLKSIGFTVALIGLLEGAAQFVAGISKGYFGKLSDTTGKRVLFVRLGYILSAVAKPVMAFFTNTGLIFLARTSDRLGKGVRSNARDAILSSETTPEHKGKVFGFHQSFDTIGAAIGPICALVYLYFNPGQYQRLFLIAFLPSVLSVLFTFFVRDKNDGMSAPPKSAGSRKGFFGFLGYWKTASVSYKSVVPVLLVFAFLNSSDTFLLLMMKHQGLSDTQLILVYIFYNLVFAAMAYPAGVLADRFGLKYTFMLGCVLYAITYIAFPYTHSMWMFGILYLVYGIYSAATEGIARAWVSNLAHKGQTATALGFYTSLASICALSASFIGGLLWDKFGPTATFLVSGIGIALVALVLVFTKTHNQDTEVSPLAAKP